MNYNNETDLHTPSVPEKSKGIYMLHQSWRGLKYLDLHVLSVLEKVIMIYILRLSWRRLQ